MRKLTQKYALVHLFEDLPKGYEFSASNWPLHITIADVFAISSRSKELLADLAGLRTLHPINSEAEDEDWFGENKDIHVHLMTKPIHLQELHEDVLEILSKNSVVFNNPEYTGDGFKPHVTVSKNSTFNIGDSVAVDSITLIDMFPNQDPTKRRIIGTVKFAII